MNSADLVQECQKLGLTATEKHIENIQSLFEYLKKFEQQIDKDGDKGQQTAKTTYFSGTGGRHQIRGEESQIGRYGDEEEGN